MLLLRCVLSSGLVGIVVAATALVSAQDYPSKPLRIVTGAPAGGADIVARLVAQSITGPLGQAVVVDNRAGTTSGEIVSRAAPDGYTLLVAGSSFWVEPLFRKSSSDPLRGLAPVSLLAISPNVLVVPVSLPVKSVKELVDMAKAKPGVLNYASGTLGGSPHVGGELFKAMAGVDIVGIPYKGTGAAITDLMGGQVHLMFAAANSVSAHIKSGKLKALAVANAKPSALFPGLPTVGASVPGYDSGGATAMFAPAGMPTAATRRLTREIVSALEQPDVKEKFFNGGTETVASTPEQLADRIKSETARLNKIMGDGRLRTD